jgi:trk system potassium uptake protein
MFIGGSPGSIAGGVKTTTFFIAFFYLLRGNEEKNNVSLFRRNISSNAINKAISIVIKSFLIVFIAFLLLIISEQQSLLQNSFSISDLLFETVSAFGTVGLSCGVTSQLSFLGKLIIIATMFIGRTGIFAMALGSSRNIIEKRFIRYPEESVLIG